MRCPEKYAHVEARDAEKEGAVHLYLCSNHPYSSDLRCSALPSTCSSQSSAQAVLKAGSFVSALLL